VASEKKGVKSLTNTSNGPAVGMGRRGWILDGSPLGASPLLPTSLSTNFPFSINDYLAR